MLKVLGILYDMVNLFLSSIFGTIQFIYTFLTTIPNFLKNILNELPYVFKYGFTTLIGLIVLVVLAKIISLCVSMKG